MSRHKEPGTPRQLRGGRIRSADRNKQKRDGGWARKSTRAAALVLWRHCPNPQTETKTKAEKRVRQRETL